MFRRIFAPLILACALPAAVRAQTCFGRGSSERPKQIGGRMTASDSTHAWYGDALYASSALYAAVFVGETSVDNSTQAAEVIGAQSGRMWGFEPDAEGNRKQICGYGQAARIVARNTIAGDATEWDGSIGVAAGIESPLSSIIKLVPTVGASFGIAHSSATTRLTTDRGVRPFGTITGGIGLLFFDSVAIVPHAAIGLGLRNAQLTGGVAGMIGIP